MTDYYHDSWCAIYLDEAPESECDCVRAVLIRKDAQIAVAEMRIISLANRIDRMLAVDSGHFVYVGDYRNAIVDVSKPDKATASEIVAALEITREEVAEAIKTLEITRSRGEEMFARISCLVVVVALIIAAYFVYMNFVR